jgi:hypothetical protein
MEDSLMPLIMKMKKQEIKNCPFCGTEELRTVNNDLIHLIVEENKCPLNGIVMKIKEWNHRCP